MFSQIQEQINWLHHKQSKKQTTTYEIAMFAKTQTQMKINWLNLMTTKNNNIYI